ncbi:MAG: hypothetical protein ACM3SV_06830 [Betaproteobacteria bacterium]
MRLLFTTSVLAITFVYITGGSLPPTVASHFTIGGAANAFMARGVYLKLMVAVMVGAPLLIAVLGSVVSVLPIRFINLPDRDYWLAPERQADTLAYISKQGSRLGVMLIIFLGFVHWLVVQANAHTPPVLSERLFFIGMGIFLISILTGLGTFVVHFYRRP